MNKRRIIALAVVALLLIGAVAVLMPGLTASTSDMTGNMTVYIRPYGDSGDQQAANANIGPPDTAEQFMMTFGQSIRTTTFTPNFTQNVAGIFKEAKYEVWAVATIKITGQNVKSLTSSLVSIYGQVGMLSSGAYTHNAATAGQCQSLAEANALVLNTSKTFDFSKLTSAANPPGGGKFTLKQDVNSKVYTDFKGLDIDKFVITLNVAAQGPGPGGIVVNLARSVTLQITVTNWAAAIMTLSVTGFTVSTNAVSMILPMEMAAQPRFEAS